MANYNNPARDALTRAVGSAIANGAPIIEEIPTPELEALRYRDEAREDARATLRASEDTRPDRPRKTASVAAIVRDANAMMAATPDGMTAEREGMAALVERILHNANAYAGFRFTDGARGEIDESRRAYYVDRRIA